MIKGSAGTAPLALCIDIGKSGSRARLTGPDIDAVARVGGIEPEAAGRCAGGMRLLRVAETLWAKLAAGDPTVTDRQLGKVVVGSTSVPPDAEIGVFLEQAGTRWPNASIAVADDGILGHAAAVGGPGIYVSIGTGVIVYGLDRQGKWHRKDGWGPDLGDRGGALWLGSAGLVEALRAVDGAAPATALLAEARRYLGGTDLVAAVQLAARVDRAAALAGFARSVCRLAPGDQAAAELVERAAGLVCETASAMARDIEMQEIAVGGQLAQDEGYWRAFEARCIEAGLRCSRSETAPWEADPAVLFSPAYSSACTGIRS